MKQFFTVLLSSIESEEKKEKTEDRNVTLLLQIRQRNLKRMLLKEQNESILPCQSMLVTNQSSSTNDSIIGNLNQPSTTIAY